MPCHLFRFFCIDRHQPRQIVLLLPPGRHQSALNTAVLLRLWPSPGRAPWAWTAELTRPLRGRQMPFSFQRYKKGRTEGLSWGWTRYSAADIPAGGRLRQVPLRPASPKHKPQPPGVCPTARAASAAQSKRWHLRGGADICYSQCWNSSISFWGVKCGSGQAITDSLHPAQFSFLSSLITWIWQLLFILSPWPATLASSSVLFSRGQY